MTKTINVTQADIDNGKPLSIRTCMLALAMRRDLDAPNLKVGVGNFTITGSWAAIRSLPLVAYDARRAFDLGRPVAPFSFEVSLV